MCSSSSFLLWTEGKNKRLVLMAQINFKSSINYKFVSVFYVNKILIMSHEVSELFLVIKEFFLPILIGVIFFLNTFFFDLVELLYINFSY